MTATITPRPAPVAPQVPQVSAWLNNATWISGASAITYEDQANETGSWSFQLPAGPSFAAQRASMTHGAVVAFRELGATTPAFVGIVEEIVVNTVAAGEDRGQFWLFSGRGIIAELERVVIYGPRPLVDWSEGHGLDGLRLGLKPYPDTRYWNWAGPSLNRSGWGTPVQIAQAGQSPPMWPPLGYLGAPWPWPTPQSWWIAPRPIVGNAHPPGDWYADTTVTTGTAPVAFSYDLFLAVGFEDEAWVWWDGDLLGHIKSPLTPMVITVDANSAPHHMAVKVTHRGTNQPGQITGLQCTVLRHYDNGGGLVFPPLRISQSAGWRVLDIGQPAPGYRVDEIVRESVNEGKARGTTPSWSFGFSAPNDSASDPFSRIPEFSFPTGSKVLDLLRALSEDYIDFAANPAQLRQLRIWHHRDTVVPGGVAAGAGQTLAITAVPGTNLLELTHHSTAAEATTMLCRWGGGYLEVWDPDDTQRLEAFLSTPDIIGGPAALFSAANARQPLAVPGESIEGLRHRLTDLPAYRVFDRITAPTRDGGSTQWRVVSRAVSTDEDGNGTVTTALGVPRDDEQARDARWRRRLVGTLDGRSEQARQPSWSVVDAGDVRSYRFRFSTGGSVSLVGDRGTPAHPGAVYLVTGFEVNCDVPGASGPTTVRCEINGNPAASATLPNLGGHGSSLLATPTLVRPTDQLNVECTAAGGHMGVTAEIICMEVP